MAKTVKLTDAERKIINEFTSKIAKSIHRRFPWGDKRDLATYHVQSHVSLSLAFSIAGLDAQAKKNKKVR